MRFDLVEAVASRRMVSLFRERDFRLLFAGQGISAVGTAVAYVALPLIAVAYLGAGPFEVA